MKKIDVVIAIIISIMLWIMMSECYASTAWAYELVPMGRFRTTGYCNCRKCAGKWAGEPTASGVMPVEGTTIATDPDVIPRWTKVMINGHIYVAQDEGKNIYGNRIDVYYDDHDVAYDHGVQYADVYIVKED